MTDIMAKIQCDQRVAVDPSHLGRQKDLLGARVTAEQPGLEERKSGSGQRKTAAYQGDHDVQETKKKHKVFSTSEGSLEVL
jgi:hypothetical protein